MAEHDAPGAPAAAQGGAGNAGQATEIISALRRAASPEQAAALVAAFYAERQLKAA
jgi:hypothetical protein